MRERWNAIYCRWGKEKRDVSKTEIRAMLFSKPENLADPIEVYRKATGNRYDFDKEPDGLLSWESKSLPQDYVGKVTFCGGRGV